MIIQGILHETLHQHSESEASYRAALEVVPGHLAALEQLGRVYMRYKETIPAAVECLFRIIELNPSSYVSWYLLGRCYMATGQHIDAFEAYNRAINLNPNDHQIWCSLGILYYTFGQYQEALGMFSRALKLDSTSAEAWYNVGALYDVCGQPEDAELAYIKAQDNGLAERIAADTKNTDLSSLMLNPIAGDEFLGRSKPSTSPSPTSSDSSPESEPISERVQRPLNLPTDQESSINDLREIDSVI